VNDIPVVRAEVKETENRRTGNFVLCGEPNLTVSYKERQIRIGLQK